MFRILRDRNRGTDFGRLCLSSFASRINGCKYRHLRPDVSPIVATHSGQIVPANRISHVFTVFVVTDGVRIRNVETDRVVATTRARIASANGEGWFTVEERRATLEQPQSAEAQR